MQNKFFNRARMYKKNGQKGFFLLDSMVGVLIVAVGLVALAALYNYGIGIMTSADRQEKAVQIGAEQIEFIKTADGHTQADLDRVIAHINDNNVVQSGDKIGQKDANIEFKVAAEDKGTLSGYSGDDTLHLVVVTVNWSDPQAQKIIFETYVQAN